METKAGIHESKLTTLTLDVRDRHIPSPQAEINQPDTGEGDANGAPGSRTTLLSPAIPVGAHWGLLARPGRAFLSYHAVHCADDPGSLRHQERRTILIPAVELADDQFSQSRLGRQALQPPPVEEDGDNTSSYTGPPASTPSTSTTDSSDEPHAVTLTLETGAGKEAESPVTPPAPSSPHQPDRPPSMLESVVSSTTRPSSPKAFKTFHDGVRKGGHDSLCCYDRPGKPAFIRRRDMV